MSQETQRFTEIQISTRVMRAIHYPEEGMLECEMAEQLAEEFSLEDLESCYDQAVKNLALFSIFAADHGLNALYRDLAQKVVDFLRIVIRQKQQ